MIEEGSTVLLRRNDVYKSVKLIKGRKVAYNKLNFIADDAIGLPFGTQFEIVNGRLVPVTGNEGAGPSDKGTTPGDVGSAPDNRKVFDDGFAQKLTHEEIHLMKEKGMSGQTIMESVIEGSSSFKDKTKFSQEKYVKKKEKKHKNIITILKSSTRLLCQLNYAKGPSKICHLRMDSLSLMLALGNIRAHSNVVVMETCQGLLTGAVLERMGGHGSVVQVFFGDNPVRTILETFDHLSVSDKSILLQYPLDNIKSLLCSSSQQPLVITDALHSHNEEESEVIREGDDVSSGDEREAKRHCHDDGSHPSDDNNDSVKDIKRKERKANYLKAAALLQRRQMDGLLIACRFHPENILMSLLEFIAPSRPIVVYCQFQEPLVQCYRSLKESGRIFNIQLSETWCRKYQVLQDRTHPVVNMDGQSGYLLHGITLNQ